MVGFALAIFQYLNVFLAEFVSAYDATKPAVGHDWSEMQCTSDMCIDTTNHRVGIGTDSPAESLEVTGDILSTGDVCNGGGKCLDSVFQTNVTSGTNPTCPSGQSIIMKAYNGTWYTADNGSITSWNKVACGTIMTSDGTPGLVNGNHTQKNCTDANGTVVSDGTYDMCRFDSASCPSGWTQYQHWITTAAFNLNIPQDVCGNCLPPRSGLTNYIWSWGNAAANSFCYCYTPIYPSSCNYSITGGDTCNQHNACNYGYYNCGTVVSPTITQIGCY